MLAGPTELILIIGAFLLLFGPNKVPQLVNTARDLTRQLKDGISDTANKVTKEAQPSKEVTDLELIHSYAKDLGIDISGKSTTELAREILNLKG